MQKQRFLLLSLILFLAGALPAQRTVGVLQYDPARAFDGYNLFFPHDQPNVFLINNCGEIVHTWTDDPSYRPGNMVYLLEDGRLLKCKRDNQPVSYPIWAGGGGGIIELRDWDNNLLWSFEQNDSLRRLHHDVEPLPNGNILAISWELKTTAEALQAGRDPAALPDSELWPDYILEIDPETDEIVWEWRVWDHLIQDFDPTKDNYGSVADHPERVDINYHTNNGRADWMHTNAIDYHPALDQILICVPTFHEVWVIDHSTTTEEAAGSTGGLSGRGGDLLYRWGNPAAYRRGTEADQQLFYPHDIHWLRDFLPPDHLHYDKLGVFNNRVTTSYSTVNIFTPEFSVQDWSYPLDTGAWQPAGFDLTVTHPDPPRLFSGGLSSMQVLPNDNLLICSGRLGYIFELTPDHEIVWEYRAPLSGGEPVAQGDTLGAANSFVFRFKRYPVDYPAFTGRDLTPQGYIELNPDTAFCDQLLSAGAPPAGPALRLYPNPAHGFATLEWSGAPGAEVEVFDARGQQRYRGVLTAGANRLLTADWPAGVYFIRIAGKTSGRLLVQ